MRKHVTWRWAERKLILVFGNAKLEEEHSTTKANERMFSFSSSAVCVCGAEHKSFANIWITKWERKEEILLSLEGGGAIDCRTVLESLEMLATCIYSAAVLLFTRLLINSSPFANSLGGNFKIAAFWDFEEKAKPREKELNQTNASEKKWASLF